MPSKALLHAAAARLSAGRTGRRAHGRIMAAKQSLVDYLAASREQAVEAKQQRGLEVISGQARFVGPHTIDIHGRRVSAAKFVIASGSIEAVPNVDGLEATGYLTSESFLDLQDLPPSLIVLGGGAIALELAQYAVRMGVETTLVQRSAHVLSNEDPAVGSIIQEALAAEGVHIITSTRLIKAGADGPVKTLTLEHEGSRRDLLAEAVLVALGRRPLVEGLGLEAAGVEVERGAVKVNQFMQTSAPHIFAAGDVAGGSMIVNLAIVQGETAGYNATHENMRAVADKVVPRAVFTDPQFARVGLNAAQAKAASIDCVEASYDLSTSGVARTYPQPIRGVVAMRAAKDDGRLIGAEIVAPEASLMIHDVAVAMGLGAGPAAIAEIPYIHPCLSEATNFCAEMLVRKLAKA